MKRFHVTFFYLATGMEGRADKHDYGVVSAPDELAAKNIVLGSEFRSCPQDWDFIRGCLSAREVK